MKLCTFRINDDLCGEAAETSRCTDHPYEERFKPSRQARGYDEAWNRLSLKARKLQPWCSTCGTSEDLTGDHLRWPARTLADLDVLCRSCNAKKGAPNPGGKGQTEPSPDPRGKAFTFTQFLAGEAVGG